VADTKRKFYEGFSRPIPGIYSNVIQELLVQHHIMRFNKSYSYDEASHREGLPAPDLHNYCADMCSMMACNNRNIYL
jgi:hypothetical protein